MKRALVLFLLIGCMCVAFPGLGSERPEHQMRLGIDADNWSGQVDSDAFEKSLRLLQIDFISWHITPEEESHPDLLRRIAAFCGRNHWHYLFNTELANYRRGDKRFIHPDGTYRYDLADATLAQLRDDPLFLGVIYDETDLMQALLGVPDGMHGTIMPYLADTHGMTVDEAFLAVSNKVSSLASHYRHYGKRLIFEMTFPDSAHAFTRGGALVAPKLLKENFNDLMYSVYRGAALEYKSSELWACIDLWFMDKFPTAGEYGKGFHTPRELLASLQFAFTSGFDYVYIEQVKGLLDSTFQLTEYGRTVVDFNIWRTQQSSGDWRTAPISYYVKRFPDGYWGQQYSAFIPDHPYGSWAPNPYRELDRQWFQTLHKLSNGTIPEDSDTWNATKSPGFSNYPYRSMAGLPPMAVYDHFGVVPTRTKAAVIDLLPRSRTP